MSAAGCHTPGMVASRLRALTFAGLAATSASLAHGGVAALADPRWGLPALAGAGIATAVLLAGWRLVAARGSGKAPTYAAIDEANPLALALLEQRGRGTLYVMINCCSQPR